MSLTIVMPAHNEGARIDRTLSTYRAHFPETDVEFHVALDGCVDATADVVARHALADPRVHLHEYPKLGKGGVLAETLLRSRTDFVGFVDADGATPPAEFERIAHVAAAADGAFGSRRLPASVTPGRRSLTRSATSSGFAWLVRRVFRLPYADTQCGAKVFRRDVVERTLPQVSARDFLFDVDLLVAARDAGFDVVETPTVWVDQPGSKVRPARDAARMLTGTLRLRRHRRRRMEATARAAAGHLPRSVDPRHADDRRVAHVTA